MRRFDREFEATNLLRTQGTTNLVAAAQASGARRLVAQSFAGWPYARTGGLVKTEDDELDPDPPAKFHGTLEAICYLEHTVLTVEGIEGVVLRYGWFYGPGTSLGEGGKYLEVIRRRQFPIIGDGTGVWSFIHLEDAAAATVAAVTHGAPGLYNVVDDDPAPVREWLPYLAECLGVKPPMRAPAWLGKLLAGDLVVALMTEARGASNAKARRELDWAPGYPSWRDGFPDWAKPAERARAA